MNKTESISQALQFFVEIIGRLLIRHCRGRGLKFLLGAWSYLFIRDHRFCPDCQFADQPVLPGDISHFANVLSVEHPLLYPGLVQNRP